MAKQLYTGSFSQMIGDLFTSYIRAFDITYKPEETPPESEIEPPYEPEILEVGIEKTEKDTYDDTPEIKPSKMKKMSLYSSLFPGLAEKKEKRRIMTEENRTLGMLDKQYDTGEIDHDEYLKQRTKVKEETHERFKEIEKEYGPGTLSKVWSYIENKYRKEFKEGEGILYTDVSEVFESIGKGAKNLYKGVSKKKRKVREEPGHEELRIDLSREDAMEKENIIERFEGYKGEEGKKKKKRGYKGLTITMKEDDAFRKIGDSLYKMMTLGGLLKKKGERRMKVKREKMPRERHKKFKYKSPEHIEKSKRLKKYLLAGTAWTGALVLSTAGFVLYQQKCKEKPVPPPTPPRPPVHKPVPVKPKTPAVKPSESMLSNDIKWGYKQKNWDILPPADDSKKVGYDERHYRVYTDVSLNGNVLSLTHPDATNGGEKVKYVGVKLEGGKWIYLLPGSIFNIALNNYQMRKMAHGGKLNYQVVGLEEVEEGERYLARVSYENAVAMLSNKDFGKLMQQSIAADLDSMTKDKSDSGVYALLNNKGFNNAFNDYMDKRRDNGEDLGLVDDPFADFTNSIAEMYNDGIAPWKIGRQFGMSTQDVYQSISAADIVKKPERYNAKLFQTLLYA